VAARIAGLAGTLVLTHFIPPQDYGAVSIAAVSILSATRFLNLGLGAYVISHASPPREVFQAFLLHTTAMALACGAAVVFRGQIAEAVGVPSAARYFPGLALAALALQLSQIPSSTLVRSLRFRVVATSRAFGEIAFTVTSLALAPLLGAMAIVVGNVARSTLVSGLLLRRANRAEWLQPAALDRGTMARFFGFGLPLTGAALADTAASQWDNFLVGGMFGPRVVGQYALAYNLAQTPAGNVAEPISDVLLPSFAKVEPGRRKDAFLRAVSLIALVSFPLAFGLAAVSRRLIDAVLDARWAAVGPMLALLSGISLMRPLTWVVEAYLQPQKRTGVILALSAFRALAVLGLVATVGSRSPLWACGAVSVAFAVHALLCVGALSVLEGVAWTSTLGAAGRPLLAAALMGGAVFGVDRFISARPGHAAALLVLLGECVLGASLYVGLSTVLARDKVQDLWNLAKEVRSRRRQGS